MIRILAGSDDFVLTKPMIGKLKGVIDAYGEDFVVVDVNGVGYVVHCSSRTLQNLPAVGEAATLSIETHVREDMIRLFGFRSDQEREWFRLLQTVQGVGAKVALGILSALEPGALATAIGTGDKAAISRAPGVGPKLAARLCRRAQGQGAGLRAGRPQRHPPVGRARGPQGAAAGRRRGLGARQSRLWPAAGLGRRGGGAAAGGRGR